MAAIPPAPVFINGHEWTNVTDITCSGVTYDSRDVEKANGKIPTSFGCYPEDSKEVPKKNNQPWKRKYKGFWNEPNKNNKS